MFDTKTFEDKLSQVVYSAAVRGEYPRAPDQVSDADIRKTIKELKAGTVVRARTKAEYIALLAELEQQIKDIAAANTAAQEKYAADRAAVDMDFEARIAAAKKDEANQWTAIRATRTALLADCDWTQIPDAPLPDEQRKAWQSYRQALRDIPQTYERLADVVWPEAPGK